MSPKTGLSGIFDRNFRWLLSYVTEQCLCNAIDRPGPETTISGEGFCGVRQQHERTTPPQLGDDSERQGKNPEICQADRHL